jgi:molybdopterin-guanine dinucleotide biosynthesis protein A
LKFTTIILAGGQSSRMGANKALLNYRGKPMVQYPIGLALSFSSDILISANDSDYDHLGITVVGDRFPVRAPIAGIHAGLHYSATDWNLVLPCDMPHISAGLIRLLISGLDECTMLVWPFHNGYAEPLCGFYHRNLIPVMGENMAAGQFSLLDLPSRVPHRFFNLDGSPENGEMIFRNVNEPADLEG